MNQVAVRYPKCYHRVENWLKRRTCELISPSCVILSSETERVFFFLEIVSFFSSH